MSVSGRNYHRGSGVQVYRATKSVGTGALTARTWTFTQRLKLALMTTTDATARRVFGEEEQIDATAVIESTIDIQRGDALVVCEGEHALRRFVITAARPLRRYVELGCTVTPEVIDDAIPVLAGSV